MMHFAFLGRRLKSVVSKKLMSVRDIKCQILTLVGVGLGMLVSGLSTPLMAAVYKCTDQDGQIRYQDYPCADETQKSEKMVMGNPEFRREHEVQGLLILLRKRLEGEWVATESLYSLDAVARQYSDPECSQAIATYPFDTLKRMEEVQYREKLQVHKVRMSTVEFVKNTSAEVRAETYLTLVVGPDQRTEEYYLDVKVRFGSQAPRIHSQKMCSLSGKRQGLAAIN